MELWNANQVIQRKLIGDWVDWTIRVISFYNYVYVWKLHYLKIKVYDTLELLYDLFLIVCVYWWSYNVFRVSSVVKLKWFNWCISEHFSIDIYGRNNFSDILFISLAKYAARKVCSPGHRRQFIPKNPSCTFVKSFAHTSNIFATSGLGLVM